MATRAHIPATAPVIALPPVLAFIMGVPAAPRSAVEAVIERMIDALDTIDGDEGDLEPNGDELDGSLGEDDFCGHNLCFAGPGCPISDPGEPEELDADSAHGLDQREIFGPANHWREA